MIIRNTVNRTPLANNTGTIPDMCEIAPAKWRLYPLLER